MTNPFDWSYLTKVPKGWEAYGPYVVAYVTVFLLGLVASIVASRVLDRRYRDHDLHRQLAQRGTRIAMWIFAVGLIFFGFRVVEMPLLGARVWLYLCALAVVVAVGLAAWYRVARYPAALERYQQERQRQQYLRSPATPKVRRSATARRRR